MNLLDGFGFTCYRSFGNELQKFSPLNKINLFIGQNNSGKSNILKYLTNYFPSFYNYLALHSKQERTFDERLDLFKGSECRNVQNAVAINTKSEKFIKHFETAGENIRYYLQIIFNSELVKNNSEHLWYIASVETRSGGIELDADYIVEISNSVGISQLDWRNFAAELGVSTGDLSRSIDEVFRRIFQSVLTNISISIIPAVREIKTGQINNLEFSGIGLIEKLAHLQNPDYDEQENRQKFISIVNFLRSVTENSSAELEIPHPRDKILVHMDGKVLPLESLGTGIHEVIILAAAATLHSNSIICIEEPELHLHPLLQRKLLKYLLESTDNQYMITTHSSHFLDFRDVSIFHITHDGISSKINFKEKDNELVEICNDLGYRPSDLLQSNCIIWVEGPSDRIYIKYWIEYLDSSLLEGTHYSIMFYGGRLLNHLTTNDEQIDDFISLKKMNRHMCVIIDSDKEKQAQQINKTKKRIRDEMEIGLHNFVWITQGREIENYIEPDLYESCVVKVHPKSEKLKSKTRYSNLPIYIEKGNEKTANKLKVAREVKKHPIDLSILDLKQKLNQLIKFIKEANGIDSKN